MKYQSRSFRRASLVFLCFASFVFEQLLRFIMRRTETVGPWIVVRMQKAETRKPLVNYLLKASEYDATDHNMKLTEAFAAVIDVYMYICIDKSGTCT